MQAARQNHPPRVLSLFCGAGGLDLGFVRAGFDIAMAVDIDADAVLTYRANVHAGGASVRDVRALTAADLPARCDVVIGGPPCQGFSAGGRMDADDDRNALLWEYVRVVRDARPRAFVLENVPALAEHPKWASVRDRMLRDFSAMGYRVALAMLDAQDFGVPQARRRAFFVGTADGVPAVRIVLPLDPRRVTVREAIGRLPSPGSSRNPGRCVARISAARNPHVRPSPYAGLLFNGGGRPINPDAVACTLLASMGGNRTPIVDSEALASPTSCGCLREYHRRVRDGERPEVPVGLRRITTTEAALLQSFPEGFRFVGAQSSVFRQIGNAVPPKVAHSIAVAVASALAQARPSPIADAAVPSLGAVIPYDLGSTAQPPRERHPHEAREVDNANAIEAREDGSPAHEKKRKRCAH